MYHKKEDCPPQKHEQHQFCVQILKTALRRRGRTCYNNTQSLREDVTMDTGASVASHLLPKDTWVILEDTDR